MEKSSLSLGDIQEAAQRIHPYIHRTPLLRVEKLDLAVGCQTWLKPEMHQRTGAFKLRGALAKILSLSSEERTKGIVATSTGNHGLACACAAQILGIQATVVLPDDAPAIKIENARAMGAEVILWNRKWADRWKKVLDEAAAHQYVIVDTDEDYAVIAGQGTIGLEIMQDLPAVDTVVVPIGGGGLIAGVATAIKEMDSRLRVIGVQASASCVYYVSRRNGHPSRVIPQPTVADGLVTAGISNNAYPIIEKHVDEIVVVGEDEIQEAVRVVARDAKLIAEPSACVGIAALLSGKVKMNPDQKVCFVLTGGNWDIEEIGRILKKEPVSIAALEET